MLREISWVEDEDLVTYFDWVLVPYQRKVGEIYVTHFHVVLGNQVVVDQDYVDQVVVSSSTACWEKDVHGIQEEIEGLHFRSAKKNKGEPTKSSLV